MKENDTMLLRKPPGPKGPVPQLPQPSVRRDLREKMGLSQREAAGKVPISPTSFWFWENGLRQPDAGHLRAYYSLLYSWQETIREYASQP